VFSINYLVILGLMGIALLFWFESMRVREFMIKMCKRICREEDLQLLDQTVSLNKIRLGQSDYGWLSIHREYRFEVSTNGTDRLMGYVILDGRFITAVQIDYPEGATIIHPAGPKLLH
jgi:hypothetical protein